MKSLTISGALRAAQTKQETRQLRAEGKVPCVLYGGKEQIHFSAPALSFKNLVYSPNVYMVELDIEGTSKRAVMKEIQFHPVSDKLMHIDFLEVSDDKKVIVDIPVRLKGNPVGVRAGGQLINKLRKLKISALPADMPDAFELEIADMNIGDAIRVRDMKQKGVEFLDGEANVIVAVKTARTVVEETPVAAATTAAPAATEAAAAGDAKAAPAKAAPAKDEKKK
jgi:large subunit ribosomal protein L25